MSLDLANRIRNVTAVLGPTNTGKTHLAIERMLGHDTGLIGLPLRLLAREVYDKIVARVGADKVALITGEEKIKPESPRYYVCTVEAMPREADVDFLAIDEVQLAADPERGHVFTDRLLHVRGQSGDAAARRADHARGDLRSHSGRQLHIASAPVEADLRRREEDHAPAAAQRARRLLGLRGLCHRRADPAPARRRGRRAGRAQPAHAQRAGGALSVGRRRFPGGDRRHRHGPQSRRRPRGLRRHAQVRRPRASRADARRARARSAVAPAAT